MPIALRDAISAKETHLNLLVNSASPFTLSNLTHNRPGRMGCGRSSAKGRGLRAPVELATGRRGGEQMN